VLKDCLKPKQVQKPIMYGQKLVGSIKQSNRASERLTELRAALRMQGPSLVSAGATRITSSFMMAESLMRNRRALKQMQDVGPHYTHVDEIPAC
jgi:hypothetical protein